VHGLFAFDQRGTIMSLLKPFLALLGVMWLSAFSAGCATVEGVGEDIQDLGDEIEDEAEDARRRR
jgi:predicted small secreted protein